MWVDGDLEILRLPFAVTPLSYLPRAILREEFNEK